MKITHLDTSIPRPTLLAIEHASTHTTTQGAARFLELILKDTAQIERESDSVTVSQSGRIIARLVPLLGLVLSGCNPTINVTVRTIEEPAAYPIEVTPVPLIERLPMPRVTLRDGEEEL
jgi:hypothetical protein